VTKKWPQQNPNHRHPLQIENERLRAEVAAYERLVGGMKQMIKSFEDCSVIGRWKPYASDCEADE
jgi:hypothetical protein